LEVDFLFWPSRFSRFLTCWGHLSVDFSGDVFCFFFDDWVIWSVDRQGERIRGLVKWLEAFDPLDKKSRLSHLNLKSAQPAWNSLRWLLKYYIIRMMLFI